MLKNKYNYVSKTTQQHIFTLGQVKVPHSGIWRKWNVDVIPRFERVPGTLLCQNGRAELLGMGGGGAADILWPRRARESE